MSETIFNKSTIELNATNDMVNLFNIGYDNEGNYVYIENDTIYFKNITNMYPGYYTTYLCKEKDTWTLIAYNQLGSSNLWWLLCKFNNITCPLIPPQPGTILYIPTKDIITATLNQIKK